jgi:hypothetical protein
MQSKISDLTTQMLTTKNTKCVNHNKFSNLHEEITSNLKPITIQGTRNIELIQEPLSSQSTLQLHVNIQGKIHQSSLDVISVL